METNATNLISIQDANRNQMRCVDNANMVFLFSVQDWYSADAFKSFSIKMIHEGRMDYRLGYSVYSVGPAQALIGKKQPEVIATSPSKKKVVGACMNIAMSTVEEAYQVMSARNTRDIDNLLSLSPPAELVVAEKLLGLTHSPFLQSLSKKIKNFAQLTNENAVINHEFFLSVSESLLSELFQFENAINNLPPVNDSTKRELLRRVNTGREYLHDNYLNKPTVDELALQSSMSKFHFFRTFKMVYGVSPYQYQLQLRLQRARELIVSSDKSLTEISRECAFPDLTTFGKAYRRLFKVTPSSTRSDKSAVENTCFTCAAGN